MTEKHYDITGTEVEVAQEKEEQVDNRDFVTAVIVSLVVIAIGFLGLYNLLK